MRLIPGDAEHGREIGAIKVMPEAELEGLAFTRVQPGQDGTDQPRSSACSASSPTPANGPAQAGRLIETHLGRGQPAVGFVTSHGI